MSNKLQKGFTLVELLVVISIMGFLSSIVFAGVRAVRKSGQNTFRSETVGEYVKAAYLYQDTYGRFPSSGDQWQYCLAEDPVTCKYFSLDTSSSPIINAEFSEYIKVGKPFPLINHGPFKDFEGPFYDCNEDGGECLKARLVWFLDGDSPCGNNVLLEAYDAFRGVTMCILQMD